LFDVHETRHIDRGSYRAQIQITRAGHIVTFRHGGLTLTEVAATAEQPLPIRRRLMSKRVRGEHVDEINCRGGIRYQVNFQLESLQPDLFWSLQQELANDGARRGLLHTFESAGRVSLGPLSLVQLETGRRNLLVQTFHTFPDECAVLKSQTLIELARCGSTVG
jgi:hypothetical protein